MKHMTYRMVVIGGRARMSRPTNVLYPLPSVRCDRKVNAYTHVRDMSVTVIAPKVVRAGDLLKATRYALVMP